VKRENHCSLAIAYQRLVLIAGCSEFPPKPDTVSAYMHVPLIWKVKICIMPTAQNRPFISAEDPPAKV